MAKIMICDDAAFMRMMIKDILTKNGYEIAAEAENGAVAVEKYPDAKPDLVLMDITMPDMDGIQALKKIKVQMSGRSFQVVDTIRIANNKLVQVIKMGDVYLVIAVAKDNVTMLAKLTEEEMGLTEAEICNGKTPGQNGEKGQMTFQETLEKLKEHFPKKQD